MPIYNSDGTVKLTAVSGSSYTGLHAPDGSFNVVLVDALGYVGLLHSCGAYNATVVSNGVGFYNANGSMNVISNGSGGYFPLVNPGSSGITFQPLYDSIGPALVDLNFQTKQFFFNGVRYPTFSALATAVGAGVDNGDGTYTLGPVSNQPFPGYNTSEGTIVCEYFKAGSTANTFAWTIQNPTDNTNSWRLLAQNGSGARQYDVINTSVTQFTLTTFLTTNALCRSVAVMKQNDFSVHQESNFTGSSNTGNVSGGVTGISAQIGHRNNLGKLDGTINRWVYFPRAVAWEDRAGLSLRTNTTDRITGATTYFNDNRSILIGSDVWAGSVSNVGSIEFRRKGKGPYVLSNRLQLDDHNNPSFLRRSSDNRIIAHYSKHAADSTYYQRISTNPDDMTSWGAETDLGTSIGATLYAYANLVEITDGIFTFPRAQASGDTFYTWGFTKSTDQGATWAPWTKLFNEPNQRSYTRVRKRAANRINIFCNDGHPGEYTPGQNSTYHLFYDAGTFKKTDGTTLGATPYRPSTTLTKVYDATQTNISSWIADATLNADTNPSCVFATFPTPSLDHRYNYGRWNGSSWVVTQICPAGGTMYPKGDEGQPYYFGGVCIDQDDPNTVYCSREIGTNGPHRNGGWFQLFKYVTADNGATWTGTQLTFDGSDKYRPWKATGANVLTYFRGVYSSYTNYATEMAFMSV